MITVDGYSYNFQTQYKNKNKYFRCRKKNTQKCRGSVTLSPKETIVRKRVHTCSSVCKVEETIFEDVLEYEESGRRFKINGHYYNLIYETKTGNKYYVCNKKHCAIKCRGSITITSDRKIVKKVDHICNLFAQSNFLPNQMSPSQLQCILYIRWKKSLVIFAIYVILRICLDFLHLIKICILKLVERKLIKFKQKENLNNMSADLTPKSNHRSTLSYYISSSSAKSYQSTRFSKFKRFFSRQQIQQ